VFGKDRLYNLTGRALIEYEEVLYKLMGGIGSFSRLWPKVNLASVEVKKLKSGGFAPKGRMGNRGEEYVQA